ncbi:MAG: DUF3179 domain-containing (seleno)protein [Candidatus Nitrosocaldaceae archaeon]
MNTKVTSCSIDRLVWSFDGVATDGELIGKRLKRLPLDRGFWFEWLAFHPETELYYGEY